MKQRKLFIFSIASVIGICLITVWAINYYSQNVVRYFDSTYKVEQRTTQNYKLSHPFLPTIEVIVEGNKRNLVIDEQIYFVEPTDSTSSFMDTYLVHYPDGKVYMVESNMFWSEYIPGQERGNSTTNLLFSNYTPSFLVSAAYDRYFTTQGNVKQFVVAILLFFVLLAVLLFKRLQLYIFYISYLFVEEPTPTPFYFIFCKIMTGIGIFFVAIMFLKSL